MAYLAQCVDIGAGGPTRRHARAFVVSTTENRYLLPWRSINIDICYNLIDDQKIKVVRVA